MIPFKPERYNTKRICFRRSRWRIDKNFKWRFTSTVTIQSKFKWSWDKKVYEFFSISIIF